MVSETRIIIKSKLYSGMLSGAQRGTIQAKYRSIFRTLCGMRASR